MGGFISVVDPGSDQHADLDFTMNQQVSRHESTDFYNQVTEEYNKSKVDAILLFPLPDNIRYGNLKNVFKTRGLGVEDILITRQETNEEGEVIPASQREVKIKKLTSKEGKLFDSRNRRVQDTD